MSLTKSYQTFNNLSLIPRSSPILSQLQKLSPPELTEWGNYQLLYCQQLQKSNHYQLLPQLSILIVGCFNNKIQVDGLEVEDIIKRAFVKLGGKYEKYLVDKGWIEKEKETVLEYKENFLQRMYFGLKDYFN